VICILLHGPAAHGSPNLGARKITHQAYTITLDLVLLTLLFVHTQSRHNTKDKVLVATKISFVNLDIKDSICGGALSAWITSHRAIS